MRDFLRPCLCSSSRNWWCIGENTVLQLAVIALVPVAPLLLTMVPLEELLKRLLQIVL